MNKSYAVQNSTKRSPSMTGPRDHLARVNKIENKQELLDRLAKPWAASKQKKLGDVGGNLDVFLQQWTPRTTEWNRAVQNLAKWVAVQNMPYQTGQRGAFLRFMRTFVPRWPRISKQTLTRSVHRQSWDIQCSIHDEMREVHRETDVAFTADMWSSRANDRFLTATFHWLDSGWVLRQHILGKWNKLCHSRCVVVWQ